MHSIITSCSCVISMDLTVCHKQIAEEWRQQIIVVAKQGRKNFQFLESSGVGTELSFFLDLIKFLSGIN